MLEIVRRAAPNLTAGEKGAQAKIWAENLFGIIPELRLPDVFNFEFARHESDYPITQYDLKNAWRDLLQAEADKRRKLEEKQRDANPIERCVGKKYHVPKNGRDVGETIALNPYTGEDERMPCPHCRPTDEVKWKKDQIARFGEIEIKQITPEEAVEKILRPAEVYLTSSEAKDLADEYNRLVRELLAGDDGAEQLIVLFDDGANRFHHPGSWRKLYRSQDLERMIADYKKRLEEKSA
jgi:hypothetical protein